MDNGWTKAERYANMSIDALGLNTRTYNALRREGVEIVAEIMDKTMAELLEIRHFGITSLGDLIDQLAEADENLDLEARMESVEKDIAALKAKLEGPKVVGFGACETEDYPKFGAEEFLEG